MVFSVRVVVVLPVIGFLECFVVVVRLVWSPFRRCIRDGRAVVVVVRGLWRSMIVDWREFGVFLVTNFSVTDFVSSRGSGLRLVVCNRWNWNITKEHERSNLYLPRYAEHAQPGYDDGIQPTMVLLSRNLIIVLRFLFSPMYSQRDVMQGSETGSRT